MRERELNLSTTMDDKLKKVFVGNVRITACDYRHIIQLCQARNKPKPKTPKTNGFQPRRAHIHIHAALSLGSLA